VFEK
jgi:hypothetical protein